VSNCPNLARTAAIYVLFSINFAVVLYLIYFHFRPSKAKGIGNVLQAKRYSKIYVFFPPIGAPSQSAFLGKARRTVKKAREIVTGN
jgi:hypothetical protein